MQVLFVLKWQQQSEKPESSFHESEIEERSVGSCWRGTAVRCVIQLFRGFLGPRTRSRGVVFRFEGGGHVGAQRGRGGFHWRGGVRSWCRLALEAETKESAHNYYFRCIKFTICHTKLGIIEAPAVSQIMADLDPGDVSFVLIKSLLF